MPAIEHGGLIAELQHPLDPKLEFVLETRSPGLKGSLTNSQVPGITGIYANCPNIGFQVNFMITLLPAKITQYKFFCQLLF